MNKKSLLNFLSRICVLLVMVTSVFIFFSACDNTTKPLSAYEIAVQNGFRGTEEQWLESLKGKSAYELAVENGFDGTQEQWLMSLQGKNGEDGEDLKTVDTYELYQTAKNNGEIIDENYSYLDFLRDYYNVTGNYSYQTAMKNMMSVVSVYAFANEYSYGRDNEATSGSGVILDLDENGNAYVITNYHVTYMNAADPYPVYKLYLCNSNIPVRATFVAGSLTYDISILKVEASETLVEAHAQKIEFRESEIELGEKCYAIGDANGSGISLTSGVISTKDEIVLIKIGTIKYPFREIRHDAYIDHGSSGGALFDTDGKLVGITNGGLSMMNYAIPFNIVKPLCENLITNYESTGNRYARIANVGIDDYKKEYYDKNYCIYADEILPVYDLDTGKINYREKIFINSIKEGSLVDIAGNLQVGDQILSIEYNGVVYENENLRSFTLSDLLLTSKVGDVITINAKRTTTSNSEVSCSVTITEQSMYDIP